MPMRPLVVLLLLSLASCAGGALAPGANVSVTGGATSAGAMRRDLYAFSDDSMRGRRTGTPDALRAARFLVERVRALGLEPAGDSLYLQRVPLQRERYSAATHMAVEDHDGRSTPQIGRAHV